MKAIQSKPTELFSPGPDTYVYDSWADMMGWMMVGFVVVWIPIMMVAQWFKDGLWKVSSIQFNSIQTYLYILDLYYL